MASGGSVKCGPAVASPSNDRLPSPGELLRELGITPSKALGQHFLHDRKIVERIVRESGIGADDIVIEIGPGLGILTRQLARTAQRVVVIEKDSRLADALRIPGVEVVEADALDVDYSSVADGEPWHVVSNLPYSVGTAIVQRLQESEHPPQTLTLMLQREVVDRMTARPPDMNLLATGVRFHGIPKTLFRVGKGAFVPPPNVESAVVRIETRAQPLLTRELQPELFRIVRAGFAQPRKQLVNNLVHGLGIDRSNAVSALAGAGIDPTARPERLDVAAWIALYRKLVP